MGECAICHSEIYENVFMSCSNKHGFCFKCILESVEKTNTLMNCPLCRGGDKIIILDQNSAENESNDFYSLYNFKKSMPFINSVMNGEIMENFNSCIVSEKDILFYVKNKNQLMFSQYLINKFEFTNIVKYIKWSKGSPNLTDGTSSDFVDYLTGMASEAMFGRGGGIPTSGSGNPFPGVSYSYRFTPYSPQ